MDGGYSVTRERLIVGVLGSIGAIMTNFIGAMYMKMFSEIIQSLTKFHNSLVFTHHLHFANVLVSKIATQELREKTLAEIATAMKAAAPA